MIAHIFPFRLSTIHPNKTTSISYKNVTELMRNEPAVTRVSLYRRPGMQGRKRSIPTALPVEPLVAGNDMLCSCLNDIPWAIERIKLADRQRPLAGPRRSTAGKYCWPNTSTGLSKWQPVSIENPGSRSKQ